VTKSGARDAHEAVLFALLHSSREMYPFPRVHLHGLEASPIYRIAPIDGHLAASTPTEASGTYWMEYGVDLELRGDFLAAAFTLERTASGRNQP
jgi:alpha-galactosidase